MYDRTKSHHMTQNDTLISSPILSNTLNDIKHESHLMDFYDIPTSELYDFHANNFAVQPSTKALQIPLSHTVQ